MCDVSTDKEWIDDLLDNDKNSLKDPLYQLVESGGFDLILTFASGGYDVIYPRSDHIIEKQYFANISRIIDDEPPMNPCGVLDKPSVIEQKQQELSNKMYQDHRVPMFTIRLGCCGMPTNAEIATVWRANIQKILNFVYLSSSGVEGKVMDVSGSAIRNAAVSIDSAPFVAVTKNLAHFKVILVPGDHKIVVKAPSFLDFESTFKVTKYTLNSLGNIVLYANDDKREHHQYLSTSPAAQISGKYIVTFLYKYNQSKVTFLL